MSRVYVFTEIETAFVGKAANYCHRRYSAWGLERADFQQEMLAWLYTPSNTDKVLDWLGASPQRTTRIYRSLLDAAISLGEKEKAQRCGYSVDDITWYSPSIIEAILPLALDDEYTGGLDGQKAPGSHHGSGGAPHETGDIMAMVVDVRKAIAATGLSGYFMLNDSLSDPDRYRDNVRALVDYLGGSRPSVGRRRVVSNSAAIHMTKEQAA